MALPPPWISETCPVTRGKHDFGFWAEGLGSPGGSCNECHKTWVHNGRSGYAFGYKSTYERNAESK